MSQAGASARNAARTSLWRPSAFATWAPRGRTHLLCVACAALITYASWTGAHPYAQSALPFEVLGGLVLACCSLAPVPATVVLVGLAVVFNLFAAEPGVTLMPDLGVWLSAGIVVSRGFRREVAYGAVALDAAVMAMTALRIVDSHGLSLDLVYYTVLLGGGFIVGCEVSRRPREEMDARQSQLTEDLARQRRLLVAELHDTVVRDLTQTVMEAEQTRLAHPDDELLDSALSSINARVRSSIAQLRSSMRALGQEEGLDVEASTPPRAVKQVVADTVTLARPRGVELEVHGLGALSRPGMSAGARQQLTRVLDELVVNIGRYAGPGRAVVQVESDGRSLEVLAANEIDPALARQEGDPHPGLGLSVARSRVESLGGSMTVQTAGGRFAVTISMPL